MPLITDIDFERSDKLREMLRSEGMSEKAWGTITTALAEVREITERAAQPEETPKRIVPGWIYELLDDEAFHEPHHPRCYSGDDLDRCVCGLIHKRAALIAAAFGKEGK